MPFIGKVILITGASSGIGEACALFFAKKGALLALVGRNEEKFASVMEKIQDCGVEMEPLMILADVCVDAERIISETIEKYGRLDVLINNAGYGGVGTIETATMEQFDGMWQTNVRAVFELTQLAIPYLIESRGNVVNISSVVSLRAFKNCVAYSVTKAALDHFTRCCAIDLADKGVRVNALNPAFIDTNFLTVAIGIEKDDDAYAEVVENMTKTHPIGRIGSTHDCVNAISFLAKDSSSFVTGVTLPICGGRSILSPEF
ncbi:uncharacterized oxidoreductase TM_0325-like [Sitodiplosis mosellana]|uniref:uncharacterized oxidoreductase TM_0325-like n=1 Tax=Sitodiplosis mosellana TaxID=263140 RepID=UPI002444F3BE|nr:uncharacterized oxidoreductase TM_0325-like [Sitodiplosis mosellana]